MKAVTQVVYKSEAGRELVRVLGEAITVVPSTVTHEECAELSEALQLAAKLAKKESANPVKT